MCLLIDSCSLSVVFNNRNSKHKEFEPVYKFINEGKGTLVYGGTRYLAELAKAERYLKLFIEFTKSQKARLLNKAAVDAAEQEVRALAAKKGFNDPHIVAIVRVAHCRLVCTSDSASIPFLKDKALYPKGAKRPKIYCGLAQRRLLRDREVTGCCPK